MIGTESDLPAFVVGIPARELAATHRNALKTIVLDSQNEFSSESDPFPILHVCCAGCGIALTGRRQFLARMAISHEISLADGEDEWATLVRKRLLPCIAEKSS